VLGMGSKGKNFHVQILRKLACEAEWNGMKDENLILESELAQIKFVGVH